MKSRLCKRLFKFLREEDGPTAVEYAIMLAAIFLACVASIGSMGTALNQKFNNIEQQMPK